MNALYKSGKFILSLLGTALLLSLVFMNFRAHAYMPISQDEHLLIYYNEIPFMVLLAAIFFLLLIALRKDLLRHISVKSILAFSAVFYLAAGLILIFCAEPVLRSDVKHCFEAALGFVQGDFSSLDRGNYLFENAHQIGFVLYETLLARISRNARVLFFANLILTLANNLLIVRLTSLCTDGNGEAVKIAGIFSLLFLPHLNFILFGYNQTVSITLMLLAAVSLGKFLRKHGFLSLFFMCLTSFLAVCVRGNAAVFVIAEIIIILLHAIRRQAARDGGDQGLSPDDPPPRKNHAPRRNALCVLAAILLLTAAITAGPLMRIAGERVTGRKMPPELPKIMWIAMGIQDGPRAAGWYNGYLYRTYRDNGYDLEKTVSQAEKESSERMQVFFGNPGLMKYFYKEKIFSTWGEATFESVWSGPLEDMGQHMNGVLLHGLYTGKRPYDFFCGYCSVVNFLIYMGAFAGIFLLLTGLARQRTRGDTGVKALSPTGLDLLLFPALLLIGGFLFHILWETKSQYVLFYVYMLIPLAAFGYAYVCPGAFRTGQR